MNIVMVLVKSPARMLEEALTQYYFSHNTTKKGGRIAGDVMGARC